MPASLFLAPIVDGEVQTPPMDADSGAQLHYTEDGVTKGGYACVGIVPLLSIALVRLISSAANLAAFKDPALWPGLEFQEDCVEEEVP